MAQSRGLSKEEFRLVNSYGQTISTPLFNLKIKPLPEAETVKLTVVIPSKLIKLSVKRQKIRRQIKAIVYKMSFKKPVGLIFYVKEPIKQVKFTDLRLIITGLSL